MEIYIYVYILVETPGSIRGEDMGSSTAWDYYHYFSASLSLYMYYHCELLILPSSLIKDST